MIETLWTTLSEDADLQHLSAGIIRRRVRPDSQQDLFLALQRPGDVRMLLLRIPAHAVPPRDRIPAADGFALEYLVVPGDPDYVTLALRLTSPEYSNLFTVMVEDVVSAVSPAPDEIDMLHTLLSRLMAWQRFLAQQRPDGLSESARQGLYGELHFLDKTLIEAIGRQAAVRAWTGPTGTPQDFGFSSAAVEVKTSSTRRPVRIKLSSELQLDDTQLSRLWLYHLSLEVTPSGGESLPDAVSSVRRHLEADPFSLALFNVVLRAAGYLDSHADLYQHDRYQIREESAFRVAEGFPRITGRDLCHGVGDVTYSISLDDCSRFAVGPDQLAHEIRGLQTWN